MPATDTIDPGPQWPQGGFAFSRQVTEQNWTVDQHTGYVSGQPVNGWERGQLMRQTSPQFRPPMLGHYAYDPTDPSSWSQGAA